MPTLKRIDTGILAMIFIVLVITVGVYLYSTDFFSLVYAAEDGLVEYATAVLLLVSGVVLVSNAVSLGRKGRRLALGLTLFYALLFFFAAGEEVSWGQRIFGWESGDVFLENNKQGETNLHNWIIQTPWGEFHLTETLFGPFLTAVVLLYLVVLPFVYPAVPALQRLANKLAIPVPGRRHALLALAASLVIAAIDVSRKWEVYELVFSLLTVSIFLLPQNREHTT